MLINRNEIEIGGLDDTAGRSKKDLLKALEMLEKANESKKELFYDERQETGFWGKFSSLLNPFKCGK
jgi:hypothetical protein